MAYHVYIDDNFHYMDASERGKHGTFATCAQSVAACQKIVDDWLHNAYQPGMTADELYNGYVQYGEDPFIQSADAACLFSAWTYAKARCQTMTGG